MNERIDELMIEAGARFEFLHGVHYDDFQYKKFAELIVRECANYITEYYPHSRYEAFYMKKHFGVEE